MVRWIIVIVVLAVIAAAIYAATTSRQTVDAAPARRGTIAAYVEERAKTRLPKTYRITMPIDGRILPIDLAEGALVGADEVLARIEPADLDTAVARAAARVEQLQASVVENNDTRLEMSLIEGLNHELVSIDRTVDAADAKTEASKAREDYRSTDLERKTEAYRQQAATLKEYEEAQLADIEARVQQRTDILTLRALEAIRKAAQIWPRTVQQYIDKKTLSEAVLQHQLADAEAALELARRNQRRGTIRSPVDGVVLHRAVSNRRMLPAGELLLELGRLDDLEIEAEILSQEAIDIAVGDEVDIHGAAIGRMPLPGVVSKIEPQGFTKISSLGVEQQRVLVIIAFAPDVLAGLGAQGRELGVGYRVRVRIFTDRRDDAVVIPRSALFRSAADRWQAFVIRRGRARLTDLAVGLMNDAEVEVISGIDADDIVILAPETDLEDGAKVEPREAE